jgi:hypothetical protein
MASASGRSSRPVKKRFRWSGPFDVKARMSTKLPCFFLCGFLVTGCTTAIYYTPNTLNVPILRSEGDGVISASSATYSLDFQGAYSPRDHLGLLIDGSRTKGDSQNSGRGYLFEGGVGYYRPFNARFMWDVYGLIGLGAVENRSPATGSQNTMNNARYLRYGLQPSAGFHSRYVDLSLASRLVRLSYFDIRGTDLNEVEYLRSERHQFLFEPAFTARAGYDRIGVQIQLGHSFNWTNRDFRQKEDLASAGVFYTFGRKEK